MTSPLDPQATDATTTQEGVDVHDRHVPTPPGGVRGADQAADMDPEHGTATGADGQTAAREQLRKDLGERSPAMGEETGSELEQGAAVGATDDPQGGSIQPHGGRP
ncbi:MAG: hypothetical protein JWN57_1765, partial [Frankiales bacterium]|jgi:hypothetical protein|nr:hypothetical protein [Frankiales bacterium]